MKHESSSVDSETVDSSDYTSTDEVTVVATATDVANELVSKNDIAFIKELAEQLRCAVNVMEHDKKTAEERLLLLQGKPLPTSVAIEKKSELAGWYKVPRGNDGGIEIVYWGGKGQYSKGLIEYLAAKGLNVADKNNHAVEARKKALRDLKPTANPNA